MQIDVLSIVVPAVLVLFAASAVLLVVRKRGNKLLRHGVPGMAVILSIQQSSAREGNKPVANIMLEVTPQAGPGFQAMVRQVISPQSSPMFQPGRQVQVRYERANRSNIIIVTDP